MAMKIAAVLSYFLMYMGWVLVTYSSFSELSRIVRVMFWSFIAAAVGYFLDENLIHGVGVGFFCLLFLCIFDAQILNGSRWAIEETIKKDLGFLNLKIMPLWLIIFLDILIFILLFRLPDVMSDQGNQ